MTLQELDLCTVQGALFRLAAADGWDMEAFGAAFMGSAVAQALDAPYHRFQWAGEEYLYARFSERTARIEAGARSWDPEAVFWAGYLYRFWHFHTGETSAEIYARADFARMALVYPGYHTLGCEQAVSRLRERKAEVA